TPVLRVPFAGGLELAVLSRGEERVLVARGPSGPWRRLAREAGELEEWTAIPGRTHVALVGKGQSLVLGAGLEKLPAPSRAEDTAGMVGARFQPAPAVVIAYFAALALFPLLAALGLARIAGRRAARDPTNITLALSAYTLAVALLLYERGSELYPP